eukprot:GHRR01035501.1.p1 GENE.GHRR01035501.1~~GHRR01035501.1.p1  ORF type:complete len:115 (+),score=24.09 GHRR01035501.1:84-428(+)
MIAFLHRYAGERGHSQEAHDATDQLLTFFDHDKDGSISFNEFLLIVVCLSVPEKDVEVVFDVMDLDDNGLIDKDEFLKVNLVLPLSVVCCGCSSSCARHAYWGVVMRGLQCHWT